MATRAQHILSMINEAAGMELVPYDPVFAARQSRPALVDVVPFEAAQKIIQPYVPLSLGGYFKARWKAWQVRKAYYNSYKIRRVRTDLQRIKDQEKKLLAAAKLQRKEDVAELWGQYVAARLQRIQGQEQTGKLYKTELGVAKPQVKKYGKPKIDIPYIAPTNAVRGLLGYRGSDDIVDAEFSNVVSRPVRLSLPPGRDLGRIGKGRAGPGRGKKGSMMGTAPMTSTPYTPPTSSYHNPRSSSGVTIRGQEFRLERRRPIALLTAKAGEST